MNLQELAVHYNVMWERAEAAFSSGAFEVDPYLTAAQDHRFGLMLVVRPPESITTKVSHLVAALKDVEPDQYYYLPEEIHTTVMSIISCREGLMLSELPVDEYIRECREVLERCATLNLLYKGITAFPGGVLLQGFCDGINPLRDLLRRQFESSSLFNTIDVRYRITTAHASLVRLRYPLRNGAAFLEVLRKYRETVFGEFCVGTIELAFSDWYQRSHNTVSLHRYPLT